MSKNTRILLILLCAALLLPTLFSCAKEVLVEDVLRLADGGKSDYRVVISADASDDIRTIAAEFVSYFEVATDCVLDVVRDNTPAQKKEIVIGRTSRAIDSSVNYDLMEEEHLLYYTEGNSLLLTGQNERAVAYAVYGFLEDYLGVRYYSADYEVVPKSETVEIPSDLVFSDKPVFWFRSMNEAGANDEKWMVKMRLNSCESLGSERFSRHPFVGGGHGYADWFVHTLGKLAEMKNDYPDRSSFTNLQPCLTDPNTYNTVLKNVRAWLEQYPDADIISISQNDGTSEGAMCTCENCKTLYRAHGNVQSALFVSFVSKIATELKDEYPDVYFDTLAYNFTLLPPKNLEIPDNMIIRIVPAHACVNHPYKECGDYEGDWPQRATAKFCSAMDGWKEIAPTRFIWDYDCLFYNYWAPMTNFDTVYENIRGYAKDGISGVFLQGNTSGSNGFSELRSYLVAKLLWNPNMEKEEFDALMVDFMEGYYGPQTSGPLTEYIDFINLQNTNRHFTLYGTMLNNFLELDVLLDDDGVTHLDYESLINPMRSYFDRAEENVTDPAHKLHLRKARTQVKYYELMALFMVVYEGDNVEIDREYRKELNTSLYQDCIECGITEISEGVLISSDPNLNYGPAYWARKD